MATTRTSLCCPWRQQLLSTRWRTSCNRMSQAHRQLYLHQPGKSKLSHIKAVRCYSTYTTRPPFLHALKQNYGDKLAIVDSLGKHTYRDLLKHSTALAPFIIANAQDHGVKTTNQVTLDGERIAFLCPNNATYVITQWAIWMAGGMAVPLCDKHPPAEIEYVVEDSQSSLLISTAAHHGVIRPIAEKFNLKYLVLNENALSDEQTGFEQESTSYDRIPSILSSVDADSVEDGLVEVDELRSAWDEMKWKNRNAMLIYTSGTTGKPKGAVTTFGAYQTQVSMMIEAWEWSNKDIVLHTLPLHHIHGVVNVLGCPLWVGATVVMLPKFDAAMVWELLLSSAAPRINVFMAVPTLYAKLVQYYHEKFTSSEERKTTKTVLSESLRLMVSGSAALPVPILNEWEDISGHRLLERYGMTEIGMALTNPLHGERVSGAVGIPFPNVEVCLVDHDGTVLVESTSQGSEVKTHSGFIEGELLVRGPGIFKEYWNRPDATADSFTKDGWFITGDTAKFEGDIYHIMGRTSVDIIKSGGYKISALEIERHLLSHEEITECAVVAIPDVIYGQQIAAILVLKPWSGLTLDSLRKWAKDKMASYKIPNQMKIVEVIPKNVMGKVNKKQLVKDFFGDGEVHFTPSTSSMQETDQSDPTTKIGRKS